MVVVGDIAITGPEVDQKFVKESIVARSRLFGWKNKKEFVEFRS